MHGHYERMSTKTSCQLDFRLAPRWENESDYKTLDNIAFWKSMVDGKIGHLREYERIITLILINGHFFAFSINS